MFRSCFTHFPLIFRSFFVSIVSATSQKEEFPKPLITLPCDRKALKKQTDLSVEEQRKRRKRFEELKTKI